jgi:hypothetical protein
MCLVLKNQAWDGHQYFRNFRNESSKMPIFENIRQGAGGRPDLIKFTKPEKSLLKI